MVVSNASASSFYLAQKSRESLVNFQNKENISQETAMLPALRNLLFSFKNFYSVNVSFNVLIEFLMELHRQFSWRSNCELQQTICYFSGYYSLEAVTIRYKSITQYFPFGNRFLVQYFLVLIV